jgi:hypothetical protein
MNTLTELNPATKLPHTRAYLTCSPGVWTMTGPFRATDQKVTPLGDLAPGWEIIDAQGRTADTAPSRDKARARARLLTAGNATITRTVSS